MNPGLSTRDVIERATLDSEVVIRNWAFQSASKVVPENWARLRERASRDTYSPIRRIAFASLEAEADLDGDRFLPFLLDPSGPIRASCQAVMEQRFQQSAAEFYRKEISNGSSHAIKICIEGLTETGDRSDALAIARLLSNGSARTRCAVLRSLRALKSDGTLDLESLLTSDVPSVAREAALSLLARNNTPTYTVWQKSLQNPNSRVWLAILKVLGSAEKWTRFHIYCDAASNSNARISAYAVDRLQRWILSYNRSFSQPSLGEATVLRESFQQVREKLPSHLVRELDFTLEAALGEH